MLTFNWQLVTLLVASAFVAVLSDIQQGPYVAPQLREEYGDELHEDENEEPSGHLESQYEMPEPSYRHGPPAGVNPMGQEPYYEVPLAEAPRHYQGGVQPVVPMSPVEYEQQQQQYYAHQQQQQQQQHHQQPPQQQHHVPRGRIGSQIRQIARVARNNLVRTIEEVKPHAQELKKDVGVQLQQAYNSPTVTALKMKAEPYMKRTASLLGEYAARGIGKVQSFSKQQPQPQQTQDQPPSVYATHQEQNYPPRPVNMQSQVQHSVYEEPQGPPRY